MNHLINQFNMINAMQTMFCSLRCDHCTYTAVWIWYYVIYNLRKKLASFIFLFCLLHLRRKKNEKYGIESTRLITMEKYFEMCSVCAIFCAVVGLFSPYEFHSIRNCILNPVSFHSLNKINGILTVFFASLWYHLSFSYSSLFSLS